VGQDVLGRESTLGDELLEGVYLFSGEGFAGPGALVAGEKGKGVGPDGFGVEDGIAQAAAGADMGPDVFCHMAVVKWCLL